MEIQTVLFRMGIGTWSTDMVTIMPNPASPKFQIGKNLPTDVGFIYGLTTYADGTDPDGNTLISTAQAQNIYITLQDGATQFFEQIRMSDLLNEFAGSPIVRGEKFLPVAIPAFDLSKSYYQNPNSYVTATIRLKLWYIQMNDWNRVKDHFSINPNYKQADKK